MKTILGQEVPAPPPLPAVQPQTQLAGDDGLRSDGRDLPLSSQSGPGLELGGQVRVLAVEGQEEREAVLADSGWLELGVAQRGLAVSAGRAEDLATGPAVMSPAGERSEDLPALLAPGHVSVRHPDWCSVAHLVHIGDTNPNTRVSALVETRPPASLLLHSTVERLQPAVPLVDIPGPQRAAPDTAGDAELRLLPRHQADDQLLQRNGVAYLQ